MRNLVTGVIRVKDKPTLICTVPQSVTSVTLENVGTDQIFIGPETVGVSGDTRGLSVKAGDQFSVSSYEHDATDVYAVAPQGKTVDVVFLMSSGS